jgi:gliding motility-associated-like protein
VINNNTGCANGISNFNLIVNPEPTVENFVPTPYCDNDDDGDDTNGIIQTIDLNGLIPDILGPGQDEDDYTVTFHPTPADAISGENILTTPYENQNDGGDTVYVRVVNDDTGCTNAESSLFIPVNPLPDFTITTPQIVCLNGPELILSVENPQGTYDYTWTDPDGNETYGSQLTVTEGGIYNIVGRTIDGTNCEREFDIVVTESIIATINESNIKIDDETSSNSITIIDPTLLGIGIYEYSLLDDEEMEVRPYQDEPFFDNLPGGIYTILVRDKNGCGVQPYDVAVVEYPKFFTPNNDGVNDTWAIKGANSTFFPGSQVNIFNRFGKVVAQINIDNPGWDGTFNGKNLPSDDYWFSVNLVHRDGVTVKNFQGNFSLLRR